MNPWTALLQSLHSALIDELNERLPDEKPELGMPIRQGRLSLPAPGVSALACEIHFETGPHGLALLAYPNEFMKPLKLAPEAFWRALLKRAGSEFSRRSIQPVLGETHPYKEGEFLPGHPAPGRVIWIPFGISSGKCFLGVAV